MSKQTSALYLPRYWPAWLVAGLLCLLAKLPYNWLIIIGKGLGRLMLRFNHKARHTAEVNLRLCFPELSDVKRQLLLSENFLATGISVVETALAWWGSEHKLSSLLHVHGFEHLDRALENGKGVIFCSAHFLALELTGRLFAKLRPFAVIYRPQKNPVLDRFARRAREQIYQQIIARGDLRGMLRSLKNNGIVWFTPDVDAGKKNSIFVDFFGVPAATITATPRLVSLSSAQILPIFCYRRADNKGYDVYISPPLVDYPTGQLAQDALKINQIIEKAIRVHPEQYLWQYKRFKTRPAGEQRFYD